MLLGLNPRRKLDDNDDDDDDAAEATPTASTPPTPPARGNAGDTSPLTVDADSESSVAYARWLSALWA